IKVSKEQRQCLSMKVCEFASKKLNTGHISVDFTQPIFKNMFNANEKFHKKATICIFAKAHKYSCEHINENGVV
ncbi:22548_t:CDS:2, partial [Rhizophagus irregularis]